MFSVKIKTVKFFHHKIHCIYATTWSAHTPWLIMGNVWAKSSLNTTEMPLNRLSFCQMSQRVMLTAIKLNLYCISVSSQIISDTVWSKTASENWMNIQYIFVDIQFNEMLNWKWAVEFSGRSKNAISDEITHKITLLCEWC